MVDLGADSISYGSIPETNVSTLTQQLTVHHILDVRRHFNPIDCMSLKIIRQELKPMNRNDLLLVLCNLYQKREIHAWCNKVGHNIVLITNDSSDNDLIRIYIEKCAT